jgi:hypothetical protein
MIVLVNVKHYLSSIILLENINNNAITEIEDYSDTYKL